MISELLSPYRNWCQNQSNTTELQQIIELEISRLGDTDYLQRKVIGKGEFDWDFRCLNEGFLKLVKPYLAQSSGVLALFLSVLQELGADTDRNREACLFIEFGHFATLINDHYIFHPDLTDDLIAPRRVSLLTQLRYAGQYLSMYPRYLLVSDRFTLSDRQQIDLHEALAGSVVVQGASRGVILKWSESKATPPSSEQYLQNCINTIHSYVAFPVILAAITAGLERNAAGILRVALGHLALAMKLAIERNSLYQHGSVTERSSPRSTVDLLSFPGLHALSKNKGAETELYDDIISESLDVFLQHLRELDLLESWGENLANSLSVRTEG